MNGTPASRSSPERDRDQIAAVRDTLAHRTREILAADTASPDPAQQERETAIVRECRYLMRLLATRRRSAGEMRERLAHRDVPADVIDEVMARVERADLVDDQAFAREWVAQRRRTRALADRALAEELRARHVGETVITAALAIGDESAPDGAPAAAPSHLDPADTEGGADPEERRARGLVRERLRPELAALGRDEDGNHRRRVARRLDGLLARKGYHGDLAVRVITTELRAATER